jgi:glycosyltransferase involved in cell wall biosynthesis
MLRRLCRNEKITYIIARGSPAGNIAYLLFKKTGIPFLVESFEPHAAYMLESGVWKKNGLRYKLQTYWEARQKQLADGIVTVSQNYRRQLQEEGVPAEKIEVAPCSVNAEMFGYSVSKRQLIRSRLNIPVSATVGIYLGKFGDIYFGAEAFPLFKAAFDFFDHFQLILLTPNSQEWIRKQCAKEGIDMNKVHVLSVPHGDVPSYLSAADFAFSLIKPAPSKAFCSPIKDGEYWAAGLPVVLPEGIGDDASILKETGLGAIYDAQKNNILECYEHIQHLLNNERTRGEIAALAVRERSIAFSKEAYRRFNLLD